LTKLIILAAVVVNRRMLAELREELRELVEELRRN